MLVTSQNKIDIAVVFNISSAQNLKLNSEKSAVMTFDKMYSWHKN